MTYSKYFKPTKAKIFDMDIMLNPIEDNGTEWASNGFIAWTVNCFKKHPLYDYWYTNKKEQKPSLTKLIPDETNYREVVPSYLIDIKDGNPITTLTDGGMFSVKVDPYFVAFFEEIHKKTFYGAGDLAYKMSMESIDKPVTVYVGNALIGLLMPMRD